MAKGKKDEVSGKYLDSTVEQLVKTIKRVGTFDIHKSPKMSIHEEIARRMMDGMPAFAVTNALASLTTEVKNGLNKAVLKLESEGIPVFVAVKHEGRDIVCVSLNGAYDKIGKISMRDWNNRRMEKRVVSAVQNTTKKAILASPENVGKLMRATVEAAAQEAPGEKVIGAFVDYFGVQAISEVVQEQAAKKAKNLLLGIGRGEDTEDYYPVSYADML